MSPSKNSTQEFVPIKEVRDGILLLKDGGMRGIILVSSLNFALKSEDERAAILYQFQDFLNSLDFSVQILVQSRKLDIRPYIALLEEQEKKQMNPLMKIQTGEYIEFVRNFAENTNIMTKNFFIVVPYEPAIISASTSGGLGMLKIKNEHGDKPQAEATFDENRTQLEERLSVVEQGMVRTGIRVARLGTEEVIELFYKAFNPGEAEKPVQAN